MIKDLERAAQALREASSVVVTVHTQPDGDALGSLLAMSRYLLKAGKSVCATWGEQIKIPSHYKWLPGIDIIVDAAKCSAADILLVLDCANAQRLGTLEDKLSSFKTIINIDHHVDNSGFGAINVLDFKAGATCEIVYKLLRLLGADIDHDMAIQLYTGIVTDTGRFQYQNTTAETLKIAADLIDLGATPSRVFEQVYENISFCSLKLLARILERATFVEDTRLIYSYIRDSDLKQLGASMADTEVFIDYLRTAKEANVVAILKETPEGKYRISLRSKGTIDVGAIARSGGGGGHRNAAGLTLDKTIEEAVEWINEKIKAQRPASSVTT
ncbi:MAG: bifunctional oligoribonuclease/PAP phosphatase NrnA [Firmicutes bacterium]|nr:bifunctional oligoribonuclease/PAP phosphatase NrnA [Bacillota bacterium]